MPAPVNLAALFGIRKLLSLLLTVMALVTDVAGQQLCDHCNCQISSVIEPQAIYRLSLVCNTGTITWFGASGGIRLHLMPFLQGNFRACFLGDSENIRVKIFQENPHVVSATNYRRKHEASRTLKLEHLVTSSAKSSEFCVNSKSAQPVLLYLEAVRTPGVEGVPKVVFHYDFERMDAHSLLDPMDECRPCTKEEMLDSYCSMDFVVVGSLSDVTDSDTGASLSDVTLQVKQVIHQRESHFFQREKRSDSHLTGHVTVPRTCGMREGDGDFILTGRYRLNSLTLRCASYLHEWRRIQHEAECSHV